MKFTRPVFHAVLAAVLCGACTATQGAAPATVEDKANASAAVSEPTYEWHPFDSEKSLLFLGTLAAAFSDHVVEGYHTAVRSNDGTVLIHGRGGFAATAREPYSLSIDSYTSGDPGVPNAAFQIYLGDLKKFSHPESGSTLVRSIDVNRSSVVLKFASNDPPYTYHFVDETGQPTPPNENAFVVVVVPLVTPSWTDTIEATYKIRVKCLDGGDDNVCNHTCTPDEGCGEGGLCNMDNPDGDGLGVCKDVACAAGDERPEWAKDQVCMLASADCSGTGFWRKPGWLDQIEISYRKCANSEHSVYPTPTNGRYTPGQPPGTSVAFEKF